MNPRTVFAVSAGLGAAAAGLVAVAYPLVFRDRCLTWGASPEEAAREMAGDDLLPDAPLISTRAVGIAAPPSAIWPWLVQMGPGRGGAYTYDWVENLFGLNMHSADEIVPDWQGLAVGDSLPLGEKLRMRVRVLEAQRAMVLFSDDGAWVWSFGLYPAGPESTRLVSRNRIQDAGAGPMSKVLTRYLMEPGSLIMERKMLLGIKERAERLFADGDESGPAVPAPCPLGKAPDAKPAANSGQARSEAG